ncbi:MAG: lysine 6-dehydrogenase, partial [Planctomycetota bacterium]
YKTIRYLGHNEQVRLLNDLGFFDSKPIETRAGAMSPRLVTEALFEKNLGEKVDDVVLVRMTAEGDRGAQRIRIVEQIIDYPDHARGLSAMARSTGYPAAIITAMLGRGEVEGAGAAPAELCIPVDKFRDELEKRDIIIERAIEILGED